MTIESLVIFLYCIKENIFLFFFSLQANKSVKIDEKYKDRKKKNFCNFLRKYRKLNDRYNDQFSA